MILSLFGKNMTIEELDSILNKLENGTLTKEDILKKGSEWKWNYGKTYLIMKAFIKQVI